MRHSHWQWFQCLRLSVSSNHPISLALFILPIERFIYSTQLRLRSFAHTHRDGIRSYCYGPRFNQKPHENSINYKVTPIKHSTAAYSVAFPAWLLRLSVRQFVRVENNQNFPHTYPVVVPLVCWHLALGAMFCLSHSRLMWVDSTAT